ncbi:MAG: hypothetical protein KBD65_00930 [Candidatus Moranbacteria bacterium]|nr:hypothetical protein [Candidatus Moranbacteria bacterium]
MAIISKKTALVWVLIVAGAVTLWKFVWKSENDDAMMAPAATRTTEPVSGNGAMMESQSPAMMADKKIVTTRTSYKNPAGEDEVAFSLTVDDNGVITDAATEVLAIHDISKMRQVAFSDGLLAVLKGKKLNELSSIDRVGGSSLTTTAFNKALPELKAQL